MIFLPLFFTLILQPNLVTVTTQDVDRIRNGPYAGSYLVTDGAGKVQIVSASSQLLWETDLPIFFVHEADMMPDGQSIIVADTAVDRVFVMNLSNKVILWDWYAKNNTHDTYMDYWNWTDFAIREGFSSEAIAVFEDFYPENFYYTHLNTVQFINGSLYGRTFDSILISLRDFGMVVEINYTAQLGEPGYMNVTWYYGDPSNHSMLHNQHAPKRWPNGHLTVCDSENKRVVEIDENNQVVWEYYDKELRWPRDCELLPNGNYLITDSSNNRIIEVNMTTKQIVKTFTHPILLIPYEADYVPEDNTIITGNNQQILIFDYESGNLIKQIGAPFAYMAAASVFLIVIPYQAVNLVLNWRSMPEKSWKGRLKSNKIYRKLMWIGFLIGVVILFNYIFSFFWHFSFWRFLEAGGMGLLSGS